MQKVELDAILRKNNEQKRVPSIVESVQIDQHNTRSVSARAVRYQAFLQQNQPAPTTERQLQTAY